MSDEQTPHSGSRWEPAVPPPPPAALPPDEAFAPAANPARRSWRDRVGRRELGAGLGALALVLVGGLGGAAVAHNVAGSDTGSEVGRVRDAGLPGADQPGPALREPPLEPDAGRLAVRGHDDDAEEHADPGEHEGTETEHPGPDT